MNQSQRPDRIIVNDISVTTSTGPNPLCHVTIEVDIGGVAQSLTFESKASDVGPVSGICGAFRKIVPDFNWADFRVRALGPGEGADAFATVYIKNNGDTFAGEGTHNNTLHASAAAVADGLNKLRWHEFNKAAQHSRLVAAGGR